MFILGISCFYHDSSAALINNGEIICAFQEERFTRIKHDPSFPINSIKHCLDYASISFDDIDKVAFYENPELKFERLLKTYKDFFPKSIPLIFRSLPSWFFKKRKWRSELKDHLSNEGFYLEGSKLVFSEHHRSHAASAFYPSPFNNAAIIVADGVGEFNTTTIWNAEGSSMEKVFEIDFPDSLGLFYSTITSFLGFKVNSGEYKVMGLAPYGKPKHVDLIKDNLINLNHDGSFNLTKKFFTYATNKKMFDSNLSKLFDKEPRKQEAHLTQEDMDIASSVQKVLEEAMMNLALRAKKDTGKQNLCLAGGVALNCVANGKILSEKIFKDIWIQPAAGDAGGSLGAALDFHFSIKTNKRIIDKNDSMKGSLLGKESKESEIYNSLSKNNCVYKKFDKESSLLFEVSEYLEQGMVVGWHQGRMEFGPRALGSRSILGDPRNADMQSKMNLKIKYRESFRPFAPAILEEDLENYFLLNHASPYMLIVSDIKDEIKINESSHKTENFGLNLLKEKRSELPAITHVDYSARIQTVSERSNKRFFKLLKVFKQRTGCPVLINTSFNVRGEPIVCSPDESIQCFMRTEMDVLVIGNFIVLKKDQTFQESDLSWKEEFSLD